MPQEIKNGGKILLCPLTAHLLSLAEGRTWGQETDFQPFLGLLISLHFPSLPPPTAHVLTPTSSLHDDDLYFYLFYEHQTHIVLQAHVFFPLLTCECL